MTNSNSVTMTSPDSTGTGTGTGSENGSAILSYPTAGPYGSTIAEAESAGAFGDLTYSTRELPPLHNLSFLFTQKSKI